MKVFQQVLERRKEVVKIELHHEQFTVAQMMDLLRQQLVAGEDGVDLIEFFESCPSRHAMIVALLAVLELDAPAGDRPGAAGIVRKDLAAKA